MSEIEALQAALAKEKVLSQKLAVSLAFVHGELVSSRKELIACTGYLKTALKRARELEESHGNGK